VLVILGAAVLAFFIFAWDRATGLSAEERREIGILKGLGWDTADVLFMKFWEGAAISLTAFLLGVIGAYVHVFFASAPLFEHALRGWATVFPTLTLRPALDPYELATLFLLTVMPYSLLTVIPTWRTAVCDPDAAMRA
jgi:ABC-type lipoprotein release transport system permease subunit